jgi:ERO1-like protein alpha
MRKALLLALIVCFVGFAHLITWEDCLCTSHRPAGVLDDCCCDASTIDENVQQILPNLKVLVASSALRYFPINLDTHCEFWNLPEVCRLPNCGICECEPDEVPALIQKTDAECSCPADLEAVDRSAPGAPHKLHERGTSQWVDWGSMQGASYVDLMRNPERFSGYLGPHIWEAIYSQNCFDRAHECRESRVFYRFLSGLHTSVNSHLAFYYMNDSKCAPYPNLPLYQERVGAHRDRVENLYFTYMLVLRAVTIAGPALTRPELFPRSGDVAEDTQARELLAAALQPTAAARCPQTFDERTLFQGEQRELLPLFRQAFRNISRIMACVGCERCQLWGTVQARGLGTALRLLFGDGAPEQLTRSEAVALLQTWHQLAESVSILHRMRAREAADRWQNLLRWSVPIALATIAVGSMLCQHRGAAKPTKPTKR